MVRSRLGTFVGAAAIALMAAACSTNDPGVTTAVKSKMAADDTVKAYRIDVDTKEGVVTLAGNVDSAAAKSRAVELARNTEGVVRVVDQLTVSPASAPTTGVSDASRDTAAAARETGAAAKGTAGEAARDTRDASKRAGESASGTADKAGDAISDAAVTTAVKSKFLADSRISGMKLDVDTKNNIVTLTGAVPTAAEKAHALDVARKTDGVKSVVDKITVQKK